MPVMIIMIAVIYFIVFAGTWHYLGSVEKKKKIIFLLIGILISYLMTLLIFSFSKSGVVYPNVQMEGTIQNVIVAIFTGLNGLLFLPYIARVWDKIEEGEISKEQFQKRIFILGVVLVLVLILECQYLKGTQQGILEIYQKAVNNS